MVECITDLGCRNLSFFLTALFAISRTSLTLMLIYRKYKSFDDGDYSTPGLLSAGKETSVFCTGRRVDWASNR